MRLTLRTLLAYLDDILEPRDAEELAGKIRESDFAGGLIHRIRNSVGRQRLSSPQVLGKGLGADANTVSEYLDNTLPSERVPDFEKVCLESDMMLSEVASCHEILTIVLGEHASVEPSLRRRIYDLASHAADAERAGREHQETGERNYRRIDSVVAKLDEAAPPAEAAIPAEAAHPTGSRLRWIVLVGSVAATIALAIWLQDTKVKPAADSAPAQLARQAAPVETGSEDRAIVETPAESSPAARDAASDQPVPQIAPATPAAGPDESIYTLPADPIPPPGTEGMSSHPDLPSAAEETAGEESKVEAPAEANPVSPPEVQAPMPSIEAEGRAAVPAGIPGEAPASTATPAGAEEPNVPAPPHPEPPAASTRALHIVPEDSFLASWREEENAWWRVADTNATPTNAPLFVLPEFTPRIFIDQGLDVAVRGPAEFTFAPDNSWTIVRGRFTVSNRQEQSSPWPVTMGTHAIDVRLTAPDTIALIEVSPMAPLGVDPAVAPRTLVGRVWVVKGAAQIGDRTGQVTEIAVGERWGFQGESEAEVIPDTLPEGVAVSSVRDIDRQARDFLAAELVVDEPLTAALRAAFRDRRTDVRSLAARGLATIDTFEPLVETFNDPRFHASWTAHYACARAAIQRSPQSAKKLQQALQTVGGPNAEMLYRMLWGFSSQQLADGAAAKLVDALEHRDLPVRVIAGETLRAITQASAGFRADYHANRRRDAIQIWRRKLRDGTVRYPVPPENDVL